MGSLKGSTVTPGGMLLAAATETKSENTAGSSSSSARGNIRTVGGGVMGEMMGRQRREAKVAIETWRQRP